VDGRRDFEKHQARTGADQKTGAGIRRTKPDEGTDEELQAYIARREREIPPADELNQTF